MTEAELQEAVARYLVTKYPDVMFHSDYGSGTKLTPKQAAIQKRQNGGRKGWPDLVIAEPREWCFVNKTCPQNIDPLPRGFTNPYPGSLPYFVSIFGNRFYRSAGLYIELKKEGTRLKKKNGDWATEHIAEQAEVLEGLRDRGYCAEFAVGFDEAVKIIDEYLGG